jgi:hypothetical protein
MRLHDIIIWFGTGIIVLCFFVSLAFAKKEKPYYYRYIFAYILMGLFLSVNTIASDNYAWRYGLKIRILIEQVLVLLQYGMFALFFWELLKKSAFANKVKWLFFLSIPILLSSIIAVHLANVEIRSSIIVNLILAIFCFFYLRDLMNNKPTVILMKSSAFWLVMGIFFSSCIGFPVSSLVPFIPKTTEYSNLRFQIFSIQNISLIIMYLFIIKSYTCLKHPQSL